MMRYSSRAWLKAAASVLLALALLLNGAGCGLIADKDRIKIAKINEDFITRGGLKKVIRAMPAKERPEIRTQGDVLLALKKHLNNEVKRLAAEPLIEDGKIHVPREMASAIYDQRNPDQVQKISSPEEYGLTEADLRYFGEVREGGIDRLQKKMLGEQAVMYLIEEAVKDGVMTVTDEEYAKEHTLRKAELLHPEKSKVRGLYFPVADPDAALHASQALKRLETGASPDAILEDFRDKGAKILQAAFENDPSKAARYGTFWEKASGADKGQAIGPIYIRGWQKTETSMTGQTMTSRLPDAYFVCTVLDHVAAQQKSLDEAKIDLQPFILYAKMMDRLWEQFGVEIYENKLPDPAVYDSRSPMAKTRR
ncbi:MAG: hypothetical protein GY851_16190 [bacterium]|nr:hypothetical protein [bacterium]